MAPIEKTKVATAVDDYTILPLTTPPLPSFPRPTKHYIYLRANAPKIPTADTPREIFVVNVPIDATEIHFRSLFADQLGGGRVEKVEFEGARVGKGISAPVAPVRTKGKKRKRGVEDAGSGDTGEAVGQLPKIWDRELHASGSTAVVTLVDKASADWALRECRRAVKHRKKILWGEGVEDRLPPLGLARYASHHRLRYPDPAVLQSSVNAFMTAFLSLEQQRATVLARQRQVPDEDGFITVTRGGRTGPARQEEAKEKEEEFKKREKSRVKEDFYRFQVREKKKSEANELVKGFEEDRRRVEEMRRRKGKGGFRPAT